MNLEKFLEYKPSPEIQSYFDYQFKTEIDDETKEEIIILNNPEMYSGGINIDTWSLDVDWLYQKSISGIIDSLAPYLQRLLLSEVWEKNKHFKAKSYDISVWNGMGKLTPFTLAPIDLLLNNIEDMLAQIPKLEPDKISQLKVLKKAITEKKHNGVELVVIDGQTRENMGFVPYLRGEFNLVKSNNHKPIIFELNGKKIDITEYTFDELPEEIRGNFLQQELTINFITQGTLSEISEALVAINSNEKWTDWQQLFNGLFVSTFPKRIYQVFRGIIGRGDKVRNFLSTYMSKAGKKYMEAQSGIEKYIAERLIWLEHHKEPKMKHMELVYDGTLAAPKASTSKKLRGYLEELQKQYTGDKIGHLWISLYTELRDLLDNYKNRKKDYYDKFGDKIPDVDILLSGNFVEWFIKTMITATSETDENGDLNTDEYYEAPDGTIEPKSESLQYHLRGSYSRESIIGRLHRILHYLNRDMDDLIKDRVLSSITKPPTKHQVMVKSKFKTFNKRVINPTKKMNNHRAHITADAKGGSKDIKNFVAQEADSNMNYKDTNLEVDND
jgi:hypothetical protein